MEWKTSWTKSKINDKWGRVIGIPLIALVVLFADDWEVKILHVQQFLLIFARNLFYVFLYWELGRLIFMYVHHRYPNLRDTSRRISLQLLLFALLILAGGLVIVAIGQYVLPHNDTDTFGTEYIEVIQKSFVLLGVVLVLYECAYLFGLYQTKLYEAEKLKKEALMAQFELLKSQIDPHFLFNSLNTLISLIPKDPKASVAFVQSLSNVYRNVLSHNDKQLIGLEMEIHLLKDYVYLFQMRFGNSLLISYELSDDIEAYYIVPFTLQMLVENAVKHNIVSHYKPLNITVKMNAYSIEVVNNLQLKISGVVSTNTGLKNIISQYGLVSTSNVLVERTDSLFRVAVPLIKKKNHEGINHRR